MCQIVLGDYRRNILIFFAVQGENAQLGFSLFTTQKMLYLTRKKACFEAPREKPGRSGTLLYFFDLYYS